MADVTALFVEAIFGNWAILLAIIFGVLAIVPYIALMALNVFNKNILKEIKSTLNRKVVRVIRIMQNGQLEILYKTMNPDKSITIREGSDGAMDDTLVPSTAPHPDASSFKQNYLCVEGQEGTVNILEKTEFDVNTPQKKMAISMAFESGREFERYTLQPSSFDLKSIIISLIPTVLLILVLIFVYSQGVNMEEMAGSMEIIATQVSAAAAAAAEGAA